MKRILKFSIYGVILAVIAGGVAAQQEDNHRQHNKSAATEIESDAERHGADEDSHGSMAEAHRADASGDGSPANRHQPNDEHETGTQLSATQIALGNIRVAVLRARNIDYQVYAPGEIKANGYTSYMVSPRVDSVVLNRHAALGDHVAAGQALVTLFSEVVADGQAAFLVANAEWQRVQILGRKAVGEKRFMATQAEYKAAYARLSAFGLSSEAIRSRTENSPAFGEYVLLAAISGAVLSDDFHQGQRVESGTALMELADESELWVEARLAPTAKVELPAGRAAKVRVGDDVFIAEVTQEAHTIDALTRTRIVRLRVNNDAHRLHPGQFADVYFTFATETPVLAVPEAALMRGADGDWTVFVEYGPALFQTQEVQLGRTFGDWREVNGINEGVKVVVEGAFFVASQMAKSGFDPHNH